MIYSEDVLITIGYTSVPYDLPDALESVAVNQIAAVKRSWGVDAEFVGAVPAGNDMGALLRFTVQPPQASNVHDVLQVLVAHNSTTVIRSSLWVITMYTPPGRRHDYEEAFLDIVSTFQAHVENGVGV